MGGTIVVVGSLHHDIMVAAPHRPEAGETVTGFSWAPKFGGKGGNQAVAAARAGANVRMLGAVGDDAFGTFLRDHLRRGGVDDRLVATLAGGSGMSVAISDPSGDYGAVIVSGANLLIDPARLTEDALWEGVGILLLQNEVTRELNVAAAREAHARGIRVCLNAAPWRPLAPGFEAALDILVVNAGEAQAMAGLPVGSLAEAMRAARALASLVPVAVVTAGGDGVAVAAGGEDFALPAERIVAVGTHGAGDTFTGTLAAALVAGASLRDAVAEANRSAARHVAGGG